MLNEEDPRIWEAKAGKGKLGQTPTRECFVYVVFYEFEMRDLETISTGRRNGRQRLQYPTGFVYAVTHVARSSL